MYIQPIFNGEAQGNINEQAQHTTSKGPIDSSKGTSAYQIPPIEIKKIIKDVT
jgi:hypothetical protein